MSFLFKRKEGGYWYIGFYNESGKRINISTKEKLKTRADQIHDQFKKKNNKSLIPEIIYLNDVKEIIFNFIKNNFTSGTLKIYESTIKNLNSMFGYKPLKSITLIDIETYKSKRLQSVSPVTLNIELRTIKSFFNYCVRFNLLFNNNLNKISQIRIKEKKLLTFSNSEINLLFGNIRHKKFKLIVKIAAYTGLRLNEILHVKYGDIDMDHKLIHIINSDQFSTKSKKNRSIPIPDILFNTLSEVFSDSGNVILIDPGQFVFSVDGNLPYDKSYITRKFKALLRKLNLNEDLHFHCLRHTYFSNLSKLNVPINYIKELAGHSSIKTTEIYLHNFRQDLNNFVSGFKY